MCRWHLAPEVRLQVQAQLGSLRSFPLPEHMMHGTHAAMRLGVQRQVEAEAFELDLLLQQEPCGCARSVVLPLWVVYTRTRQCEPTCTPDRGWHNELYMNILDLSVQGVSQTMHYSYDAVCIARLAHRGDSW